MPLFTVTTNVTSVPDNLPELLSQAVAKSTGKPESYVAVQVNAGVHMAFGGSQDKCAVCRLESIGGIGAGRNAAHSRALTDAVSRALGVDSSRIYIVFRNVEASMWGHNGSTFG